MKSYKAGSREDNPSSHKQDVELAEPAAMEDRTDIIEATDIKNEIQDASVEKKTPIEEVAGATEMTKTDVADIDVDNSKVIQRRYHGEEEATEQEQPRKRGFTPPTRQQVLNWLPFLGVILLGALLRFWGLGDKPLHHDESLHAYFSLQLLYNLENWAGCFAPGASCYHYDPLLHGPFQFHAIALTYRISQLLGAPDNGVNTFTVRIPAATLGTLIVAMPYFIRDYLGKWGAWLACLLLAVSPSMVYFSRFAREDIYMACFTMVLVVGMLRYVRDRKMRWLIIAALGFAFSYATKEATFLTIAVFGSFFVGVLVWELGLRIPFRERYSDNPDLQRYLPRTSAPILLLLYMIVGGLFAKLALSGLNALSVYTTTKTTQSDIFVQNLKNITVSIVPWIGILLGIYVLSILAREMYGKLPPPGRRGLVAKIDPQRQRMFDTILTMPWTHWFFAILAGWTVFLVLFTVVFTNIRGGIGDGIWAGLYYWIQQQQVARGGQPWYYYFMLIPLYEQIGLVFGLAGVVVSLVRPTRFRLFLAYWFVGNVFIYSWAAEKMPWLMIHMTMPMMLLAAIALQPIIVTAVNFVKERYIARAKGTVKAAAASTEHANSEEPAAEESVDNESENGAIPLSPVWTPQPKKQISVPVGALAMLGFVCAILLLLPTLHNMYEVSYVHAADGPHEMMVYVQTTTDVNTVMSKIDQLDQKNYGGKHLLPIGITDDATWPFAWYVRDYTNVCFSYPTGCAATAKNYPVIISGGDNPYGTEATYGRTYMYHQYHMRTWWDEGYKPAACIPSKTVNCGDPSQYGGVGPWLWLSYGDNPPPNAKFNLGLAAQHIWNWWWNRQAIGSTGGAYDMVLFIHKGLSVTP